MNSRLMRVLLLAIAVAIGSVAGYFLKNLDSQIDTRRSSLESLRGQAAALTRTVAELRAGQFAYVARGQGEEYWMAHVESLLAAAKKQAGEIAGGLTTATAAAELEQAGTALENFEALDLRARDFVQDGNTLLAADLIFAEGAETAAAAITHVEAAAREQSQFLLAAIAELRDQQAAIIGGSAAATLLLMVVLTLMGGTAARPAEPEAPALPAIEPIRFEAPLPKAKPAVTPRLVRTAQLCGELAQVCESRQLPELLQRASRVLDATGIIVWIADPSGRELRPGMVHGYTDTAIARMGSIARDAGNATAGAYRTAELRTVAGDNNTAGAIIVPLMTVEGCVGVLSAEMRGGAEKDESSQALAGIFAAQLATLVASPAAAPQMKAAAQG